MTAESITSEVDRLPAQGLAPFSISAGGLAHAATNLLLAVCFFVAAWSAEKAHHGNLGELVWVSGWMLVGLLALFRPAPSATSATPGAVAATVLVFAVPFLSSTAVAASGWLYQLGLWLELSGTAFSQVARLWMGTRFGVLPANRGIVTSGPFGVARHPIYLGWLTFGIGFALSYPCWRNSILLALTVGFQLYRIASEERVLGNDHAYQQYCSRVRFRLIPGLY